MAAPSGCSFVANGLASLVSGQVPTFSYRFTSHTSDIFGVQMTYMSGTSTCYGTAPTFSPYITNSVARYSRNCIWNYVQSSKYTALLCTAPVTEIPNGALTITYSNAAADVSSPRPFVATFGPSPVEISTTLTTTTTVNAIATTYLSAEPAATVTVTMSGSPTTRQTTQMITRLTTSTSTATFNSCSSTPKSSSSSSSSNRSTRESSVSSSSVRPTQSSSSAAATSTQPSSAVSCPESDNKIIQTDAGLFQVECGVDRTNHDMGTVYPSPATFEGCLAACAARNGCQQISYIPNGPCYLKSSVGSPTRNGNIIGGRLLTGDQVSIPTTSTTPTPTVQTITVTTTVSGTAYKCRCSPTDAPDILTCPFADGQIYTGACGAKYVIECNSDRFGNDLPGTLPYVYSLNDCLKACDNTPGCIDVSYNPGTPGPCYMKGVIGAIRQNSNIWGGRQVSGCTSTNLLQGLHRKRVVHLEQPQKKDIGLLDRRQAVERAPYGPDYTYISSTVTFTSTTTATSITSTTTITPIKSGTSTTTAYTTAIVTVVVTSAVPSTIIETTTVTTCPAMRFL